MRLIEVTPAPCAICGAGNVPRNDGSARQFVDCERDVNWNDPLILCDDCTMRIGGLIGMLSPETLNTLRGELRDKDQELHTIRQQMDTMKRRAKKIGIEFTPKKEKATA